MYPIVRFKERTYTLKNELTDLFTYYFRSILYIHTYFLISNISLVFIYLLLSLSLLPTYLIVIATYNFNGAVVRHLSITHRNQLLIISISRRSARVKQRARA